MATIDFGNWLQGELDKRGWTQAELARKSGLSTAAVARIINGQRGAGPEALRAIATALEIQEESIFREAGLLSPQEDTEQNPTFLEMTWLFWNSTPEEREEMVRVARALREARRAEKKRPRSGEANEAET